MVESRLNGFGGGGGRRGGEGNDGTPGGNDGNGGWGGGWGGSNNWNLETIFSMKDVSDKTRAHLTRVYTTLLTSAATCAAGMYLNATLMISGFIVMVGFMIAFAYCSYQIQNPINSENT